MQQPNRHDLLTKYTSIFITGTDTGIGKTSVATALALEAETRGLPWRYLKPAESGGGSDAAAVATATGRPERVTVGYQFKAPLAPRFAAEREATAIEPAALDATWHGMTGNPMLVEGAGGLLVPYAPDLTAADLAARWRLPLVIVVGNRLGCLNHALLTLEAAERRGLQLAGCVFNDTGGDASVERNVADLLTLHPVPLVAWLRYLPGGAAPSAAWWRDGVARAASLG